jgi:hypothetical protein
MAAVANNPKFAKKAGVPQSVGEEFLKADKGRKFAGGGEMESKKMVGKELAFMKKKGAPKSMIKHEMSEMKGMKKMAMGGLSAARGKPRMSMQAEEEGNIAFGEMEMPPTPESRKYKQGGAVNKMAHGGLAAGHKQADGIAQRGKTRGMEIKMAAGGLAAGHKQADGIAQRGKTRGMEVKMSKGGKAGKC